LFKEETPPSFMLTNFTLQGSPDTSKLWAHFQTTATHGCEVEIIRKLMYGWLHFQETG